MSSIFQNIRFLLKSPSEFFSKFDAQFISSKTTLVGLFCMFWGIIWGAMMQLYVLQFAKNDPSLEKIFPAHQIELIEKQATLELMASPLTAFFGLTLFASALHFLIRGYAAQRGKTPSYELTFGMVCWALVPMLFSIIPLVGPMIATVWVFALLVKALKQRYELSPWLAFFSILTPALFLKFTWGSALQLLALSL